MADEALSLLDPNATWDWNTPLGMDFTQQGNTSPMGQPLSPAFFFDQVTGQVVTAEQARQVDPQQFEMTNPGSVVPQGISQVINTPSGQLRNANGDVNGQVLQTLLLNRMLGGAQQTQSGSTFQNADGSVNWGNVLGIGTASLGAAGGLAGIVQALNQGGTQSTVQRNVAPPTGAEQQAQQVGLQGLQGAQQFAFGPPGGSAAGGNGGSGGLSNQLSALAPLQNNATLQALARLMQPNPFLGNAQGQPSAGMQQGQQSPQNTPPAGNGPALGIQTMGQTGSGNPLLDQLYNQSLNYGQQQGSLLGNAAVQGAQASPLLGAQAQGALQGNLPALNPALQAQIGAIYNARQQDINRYLDTALQSTLERARQQGFAGGLDTLQEATPQALMAPALAEAVRQRGALAGQQAEAELSLAQSLPQLGGNLATQNAQLLGGLAGNYTTPLSVALGGGLNLSNLNQNIVQSLGQFGQQGIQNQLGFLQALSGPVNSANSLAANQAQTRALSSGTTTTQPFNLLSAFAPTSQLLGGIGGLLTATGASQQRPSTMSGLLG